MKLLIVEDQPKTGQYLCQGLTEAGFNTEWVADGTNGQHLALTGDYDLLILDVMLPGRNGWQILQAVRSAGQDVPVLFLTARDAVEDRVHGLELGADDYLAKPFSMSELVARVKALLRRVDAMARNLKMDAGSLDLGPLFINPLTREATLAGQRLDLTPREFDLLYFFARQPGTVFSRMDLLNAVWGYSHEGYEHTVNTHINRLRAKVETDPANPARILTVWGRGYKFAEQQA